jgi:putative lipoic acid-binding regulatory protein
MDFSRLKAMLEEHETFPHDFTLKFIGLNTAAFRKGVQELATSFPKLLKQTERQSPNGSNVSLTYVFPAESAQEIVELLERVSKIPDVRMVL